MNWNIISHILTIASVFYIIIFIYCEFYVLSELCKFIVEKGVKDLSSIKYLKSELTDLENKRQNSKVYGCFCFLFWIVCSFLFSSFIVAPFNLSEEKEIGIISLCSMLLLPIFSRYSEIKTKLIYMFYIAIYYSESKEK